MSFGEEPRKASPELGSSDTREEKRYWRALEAQNGWGPGPMENRAIKDQADGHGSAVHKCVTNGAVAETGNVRGGGDLVLLPGLDRHPYGDVLQAANKLNAHLLKANLSRGNS